jgi:uncharacterized protein
VGSAMAVSKRFLGATGVVVVVVALLVAWVLVRMNQVDDPADADCAKPAITLGERRDLGDHQELEVHFRCHGSSLAGTIYSPESTGRHAAAVWVHGAGEAPRLGWGGQLVPGLVHAGVVVLSYDKRGVGQSEGECCPGDTGHFNLLTADAVGAVQAVRTLPEVDPKRVGLVGASQAGWIVPRAAVDSAAAFVALAAAPTIAERTSNLYERLAAGEEGAMSRQQISDRLRDAGSRGYDPKGDLTAMTMPGLWEFGSADEHTPVEESVRVLDELKGHGHDFTVVTFPEAGHGLLDNPPAHPDATPTLIEWVTRHDG